MFDSKLLKGSIIIATIVVAITLCNQFQPTVAAKDDVSCDETYEDLRKFMSEHLDEIIEKKLPRALENEAPYDKLYDEIIEHKEAFIEEHQADNIDDDGTLRVVVVAPDGHVVYDTNKDADGNTFAAQTAGEINENHSDRPVIMDAMKNEDGYGELDEYSETTDQHECNVAHRIGSADDPVGVLRVSEAPIHAPA